MITATPYLAYDSLSALKGLDGESPCGLQGSTPLFLEFAMDERQALLDDRAPSYNASDSDSDSLKKTDDQVQVTVGVVRDEEEAVKRPNVRMAKIVRVF